MTKEELAQAIRMSTEGRVRIERGRFGDKKYDGGRVSGWARLMGDGDVARANWDNGQVTGIAFPDETLKLVEPFPPGLEHLAVYGTARLPPHLWWPSERAEVMAARETRKPEREQALEAEERGASARDFQRDPTKEQSVEQMERRGMLMPLILSREDIETIVLALAVLAGSDQRNADAVAAVSARIETQLSWQDRS